MNKAVLSLKDITVVSIIMTISVLAHYALLHSMCDMKVTQMNLQSSLFQEFMLYEFKLGCNITDTIKNICCAKVKGTVDHISVSRSFKKFCSGYKNLNDQAMSGMLKTWILRLCSKPQMQI